jgi:endonuclease III-like uncharacterized protein
MAKLTKSKARRLKKLIIELLQHHKRIRDIDEKLEKAIEEWLKALRTVGS